MHSRFEQLSSWSVQTLSAPHSVRPTQLQATIRVASCFDITLRTYSQHHLCQTGGVVAWLYQSKPSASCADSTSGAASPIRQCLRQRATSSRPSHLVKAQISHRSPNSHVQPLRFELGHFARERLPYEWPQASFWETRPRCLLPRTYPQGHHSRFFHSLHKPRMMLTTTADSWCRVNISLHSGTSSDARDAAVGVQQTCGRQRARQQSHTRNTNGVLCTLCVRVFHAVVQEGGVLRTEVHTLIAPLVLVCKPLLQFESTTNSTKPMTSSLHNKRDGMVTTAQLSLLAAGLVMWTTLLVQVVPEVRLTKKLAEESAMRVRHRA